MKVSKLENTRKYSSTYSSGNFDFIIGRTPLGMVIPLDVCNLPDGLQIISFGLQIGVVVVWFYGVRDYLSCGWYTWIFFATVPHLKDNIEEFAVDNPRRGTENVEATENTLKLPGFYSLSQVRVLLCRVLRSHEHGCQTIHEKIFKRYKITVLTSSAQIGT